MIIYNMNTRSWAVGALLLSAFLVGSAVQVRAADSTGKQCAAKHALLTDKQAKALAATAETKADHEKLAAYFESKATSYEAEAKDHKDIARVYQDTARTGGAEHCNAEATRLRKAADDARALAAEHRQMAEEAEK